jgi:hypothetical protein
MLFIAMLSNGDLWFGSRFLAADVGADVTGGSAVAVAEPHFFPKGEKL